MCLSDDLRLVAFVATMALGDWLLVLPVLVMVCDWQHHEEAVRA